MDAYDSPLRSPIVVPITHSPRSLLRTSPSTLNPKPEETVQKLNTVKPFAFWGVPCFKVLGLRFSGSLHLEPV